MRFLLDAMCGGLRSYLRMCGHDAAYALDRADGDSAPSDDAVLSLARDEDRRVVTRDRSLAARANAAGPAGEDADERERAGAILLTERDTIDQLRELRERGVPLALDDDPTYCGTCNGPLERTAPEEPRPDYVPDDQDPVWRCRDCGRHFWKGTHWDRVRETLREL